MLSIEEPSYSKALENGRLLFVRSKPFAPKLSRGQQLRFRLLSNPTKRSREGSRVALTQPPEQMGWLIKKGELNGFRLCSAQIVREEIIRTARSEGKSMTHLAVDFHGQLEVTEPALFDDCLKAGIGSAKAFGFGMLCVAR